MLVMVFGNTHKAKIIIYAMSHTDATTVFFAVQQNQISMYALIPLRLFAGTLMFI
jgi:hypothetical protein